MDTGSKLRALRLERGLTQEKLSHLAGISRETVRVIEAGDGLPRLGTLKSLAVALGVKPSDLIDGAA